MIKPIIYTICITITLFFSNHANATVRDGHIEDVLSRIAIPIIKEAKLSKDAVKLFIVPESSPNAFVSEGQNIFVSTGLIAHSQNALLTAGVLAHEMGHISGGHLAQKSKSMKKANMASIATLLSGIAIGLAADSPEAGMAALQIGSDSNLKNFLSYNRSQESAADAVAIRIMNKIGIPSKPLIEFLKSLRSNEKMFYNEIPKYYSTHPVTGSRIDFLNNNATTTKNSAFTNDLLIDYSFAHAKVIGFTHPIHNNLRIYKSNNDEISKFILAITHFRQGKLSESVMLIESLKKLKPQYKEEILGQIYYSFGDFKKSEKHYSNLYKSSPSSTTASLEYAASLLKTNQFKKAINILNNLLSINPDATEAYPLLASAHSKIGNINLMHKYNCLYYKEFDKDESIKHCNAAHKNKEK